VALVVVDDVEVVRVDLEAPVGHRIVDADVPRGVNRQIGVNRTSQMRPCCSARRISLPQYAPRMAASKLE
jgi:hypothetical protein